MAGVLLLGAVWLAASRPVRADLTSQAKDLMANPEFRAVAGQFDGYTSLGDAADTAFDSTSIGAALKVVRKVLAVVKIVHSIYTILQNLGAPEQGSLELAFRVIGAMASTGDGQYGKMIRTIDEIAKRAGTGDAAIRVQDGERVLDMLNLSEDDRNRLKLALEGTVLLHDAARSKGKQSVDLNTAESAAKRLADATGSDDLRLFSSAVGTGIESYRLGETIELESRLLSEKQAVDWQRLLAYEPPDLKSWSQLDAEKGNSLSRVLSRETAAVEELSNLANDGNQTASQVASRPRGVDAVLRAVEAVLQWVLASGQMIEKLEPLTRVEIPTAKQVVEGLQGAALDELQTQGLVSRADANAAAQLLSGQSGYWDDVKYVLMISRALGVKHGGDVARLMSQLEELEGITSMSVEEAPKHAAQALRAIRGIMETSNRVFGLK